MKRLYFYTRLLCSELPRVVGEYAAGLQEVYPQKVCSECKCQRIFEMIFVRGYGREKEGPIRLADERFCMFQGEPAAASARCETCVLLWGPHPVGL